MSHSRRVLRIAGIGVLLLALAVAGCKVTTATERLEEMEKAAEPATYEHVEEIERPGDSKLLLEQGNERFVKGEILADDLTEERRGELAKGQRPFAVVVTCSDSRVPPELLFDQGLGDVFVVRVAGNVVDPVVLGSIEYAVEHLEAPLVVVMGHSKCGAVKAAVEGGGAPGSIGSIVQMITPAAQSAKAAGGTTEAQVEKAVVLNVQNQVLAVDSSPIVEERVAKGELEVLGATYDIATGVVKWVTAE